jgi:hypothetical protein
MVMIKGYEFEKITTISAHDRRALQYKNKIMSCLKKIGMDEDYIDISMDSIVTRKAQAMVSWYMGDDHLLFSYNSSTKFVDNLGMVAKVIEHFTNLFDKDEINEEKFLGLFAEDEDVFNQRKKAREVIGVDEDSLNFEEMHKSYKKLSKKHHPDMPEGDLEKFKKINEAHKILKRELN